MPYNKDGVRYTVESPSCFDALVCTVSVDNIDVFSVTNEKGDGYIGVSLMHTMPVPAELQFAIPYEDMLIMLDTAKKKLLQGQ